MKSDTLLDAAERAYHAKRMTWADVQAVQASLMPRCVAHGVRTAFKRDGEPICPQCVDAMTEEERRHI